MTDLVVIVGRGCAVRGARLVLLQSSQGSAAEIVGDLQQVTVAGVLRSGDLVAIWMPDEEQEAFREVVRSRFVARKIWSGTGIIWSRCWSLGPAAARQG